MIRLRFDSNERLFRKRSANSFEEVFSYYPVGSNLLGVNVGVSYGSTSDPYFHIVKFRSYRVPSSYISLRTNELLKLVEQMRKKTFVDDADPEDQIVVPEDDRKLVMKKKTAEGKSYKLFVLEQMRKGRPFLFETTMSSYDALLDALINIYELARVRQLNLETNVASNNILPLVIAGLAHFKLPNVKEEEAGSKYDSVIDGIVDDKEKLFDIFYEVLEKLQPHITSRIAYDDQELRQIAYESARTLFVTDKKVEDGEIDPHLVSLLVRESGKPSQ